MSPRFAFSGMSLVREAHRFLFEALCLLLLLQGYPAQALEIIAAEDVEARQTAVESVDPRHESEGILERAEKQASETLRSARGVLDQPWTSALGLMLGLSAYAVPQGQDFDDSPPDPPAARDQNPGKVEPPDPDTLSAILAQRDTLTAIPLLPGFNLVSLPKVPPSTDPADVLAPIAGTYTKAFVFDGCAEGLGWRTYDPTDPAATDLTEVGTHLALQIRSTTPADLPVEGTLADSTTMTLCAGWNLVGYPAAQERHVLNVFAPIRDKLLRIFEYDPFRPDDPWEFWDAQAPDWANGVKFLRPGYGYWVLVSEDVTFELKNVAPDPAASFTSPQDLDVVTAPTDVFASIESDILDSWTLRYRAIGDPDWIELATRSYPPVPGEKLATFDPTLLLNGLYEFELTATDLAGRQVSDSMAVVVEGNMKIGHFTLSLTDFAMPLSGLDLEIVRTYDSRDKRVGDFGVGWTLDIRQGTYDNNRVPGDGWQVLGGTLPCQSVQETKSHLTTIRLSDREIYRFRLRLGSPAVVLGGCFATAFFEYLDGPLPGSTLAILGNTDVIYQNASNEVLDSDSLEIFEPSDVRLTTRDGRVFDLDLELGVERLEDTNGNTLVITPTGITHSSGTTIELQRDPQGRISRILDPAGTAINYGYDGAGDLVSVTDAESNVTTFVYDGDHLLLEILDPLGRQGVRNEYDADGRLVRTLDTFGNAVELGHDIDGRREVVTDRLGNVRVMLYDDKGNVTSEIDALGNTVTRTYDARGNGLTETDTLGNTTTRTYTANNELASLTDALGNVTQLTYDARGNVLSVVGPRGETTTSSYDVAGNLMSAVDALGHTTTYTYDARGNRLTETDVEGGVTQLEYDGGGRLTRRIDPTGAETTYTYDTVGNPTSRTTRRTTASGIETLTATASFDSLGRRTSDTDPLGNTASVTYDPLGTPLTSTDRLGRTTRQVLDAAGRMIETWLPDGSTVSQTYDAEGQVLTRTDRAGRVTRHTYDALGRPTRIEHPDGSVVVQTYDALGRVTSMSDKRGNVLQIEYDALGRRTKVTNALGDVMRYTYDAAGNRTSQTDGRGNTITFEHDLLNRLVRREYPDGSEETFAYDGLGRRLSQTDQAGRTTSFTYDARGRLLTVTDALGQVTSFGYDETGARTSISDAAGRVTDLEYDALGRLVRRILPATGSPASRDSETLEYDASGNLVARIRYDGSRIEMTYDALARLVRKTYPEGSEVTYTYTTSGQRATMTDSRGTTTYAYDTQDRPISVTQPDGRALTYTYDVQGNRTSMSAILAGSTLTTTYTWDPVNRLATVTDPEGRVYTHSYDANGNRSAVGYPNGIATSYGYDSLNRLVSLSSVDSLGSTVQSYAYDLDAVGNRTRIVEADGRTTDYTYDVVDRLTIEQVSDVGGLVARNTFSYDAVGNRLEQARDFADGSSTIIPYTFDPRDRVETAGAASFTWNANGSVLSHTGLDGASYDWDHEDRLTRVTLADGTVVESAYDGDGVRVRTSTTPPGGPTQVIDYLVDTAGPLADVVAESDGSGALRALYVRGDDLLSVLRPGSGPRFYHADGLGSIRWLTDENGAVTDRYAYSAFGELLEHVGVDSNPFLFAGEPRDPNTRFTYLRARWMDPELGRFVSRDHFPGFPNDPASLHKYLYAENNPANRVDPTGQFSVINLAFAIAIIGLVATGVFSATAHHLALAKFPKNLDFSNPDAYIVGFSWSVALGHLARWLRHPVGVGLAVGFAFAGFSSSLEMLIPVDNPSQSWVYYSWGFIAGDIDRGRPGVIPTPYVGAAYNVPNAGAYTGASFCTSVNGRLAERKLGFPVNFCAGNSDPGTEPAASITLSRLSVNGRFVSGILKYGFIDVADFGTLADAVRLPETVDQLEVWAQSLVVPQP